MRRNPLTSWLLAAVFAGPVALVGCGATPEGSADIAPPGGVANQEPQATTDPAPADAAPGDPAPPADIGVEATPDTVGTKGKGYGGGIITEPISQYFRITDRLTLQFIEKGIKDYHALNNGQYPKSFDEFNEKIVKPQGLRLPELPPGREYYFDSKQGKLMVRVVSP